MKKLEKLRARLGEIQNELKAFDGLEDYTPEQLESVNAYHAEFQDINTEIEALEKLESMNNAISTSNRQTQPVEPVANKVPAGTGARTHNHYDKSYGFKSMGEFCKAVEGYSKGNVHSNFTNSTALESVGEDGGILIPTDFMTEIQEKVQGDQSLIPRTSDFTSSSNHMSVPVDETEPWTGGIQASWLGEAQQYTETKPQLKNADFKLQKLGALVKCTDELLEDAGALESYIRRKAPDSIVHKINDAIVTGDGVAKPKGILGSGFAFEVAKESGQAADSIVYRNLVKMESRLLPNSNAVWLANPACREQLRLLTDDNGNFIYLNGSQFPNAAAAGFDTLLGKPIMYMMGAMPELGDAGDLILADLSYYYSVLKTGGVRQAVSTHLHFDRDITAFKFTMRVDGHCPFSAPVTTQKGNYQMSGFVTLAERA
jgi:HK97 family phage major capsid protein